MDFFKLKKKYLKNLIAHRKNFSLVVKQTIEEENEKKTQASISKIGRGDRVIKKNLNTVSYE